MTPKQKREMADRRLRRQVAALAKYHHLPPLTAQQANKLVSHALRLRGDPITIPDLHVLYRLTARGLFAREL